MPFTGRRLRGYWWFLRRYGLLRLIRYERDRRAGVTIEYGAIFTPAELARLERQGWAPWKDPR